MTRRVDAAVAAASAAASREAAAVAGADAAAAAASEAQRAIEFDRDGLSEELEEARAQASEKLEMYKESCATLQSRLDYAAHEIHKASAKRHQRAPPRLVPSNFSRPKLCASPSL